MSAEKYAVCRNEVQDLLRRGTDEKLQKANTESALSTIREAYEKAKPLKPPWPQITAYRLAHLLFRTSDADLKQIRALFQDAMKDDVLGPMPKIYEISVLSRMQEPKEEIEASFDGAVYAIRKFSQESKQPDGSRYTAIQDCAINLLELSAYFLKWPHDKLLGLTPHGSSALFAGLGLGGDSWKLVGRNSALEKISYPKAMAEAELEALGGRPMTVLVKLSKDEEHAEWKFPGEKSYSKLQIAQAKQLPRLLKPARNESPRDVAKRQRLSRLRRELKERLGIDFAPVPDRGSTLDERIDMFVMRPVRSSIESEHA